MRAMAPPTKPRWRFHAKPHPAPRRAGPFGLQQTRWCSIFLLASASAKQLGASEFERHTKQITVAVCQRHSHTRTRAAFVPKYRRSPPVNNATLDYARFPRLFHFAGEAIFFNFNFFLIFFATPNRAQREQPIGGLGLCVRARVRSVLWHVVV